MRSAPNRTERDRGLRTRPRREAWRRLRSVGRILLPAFGTAVALACTPAPAADGERLPPEVPAEVPPGTLRADLQERLRHRIEAAGVPAVLEVAGAPLRSALSIPRFYESRVYLPVWIGDGGPRPEAEQVLGEVEAADLDGLTPSDYHADQIRAALERVATTADGNGDEDAIGALADLELLLTDAFFLFGAHLLTGRVDAETLDPSWLPSRRTADLPQILTGAFAEDGSVSGALDGLRPAHPGYRELRAALRRYRELTAAGGWPVVPDGPALERGASGEAVRALRARLAADGYLEGPAADIESPEADRWDDALDAAVRTFQDRQGLEPDGVVGPATRAALGVPARERARQIRLNLERWRWLPEELGRRYVLVNAADFRLQAIEEDTAALEMRAIVGRPYRRTPVFSDQISYLVLSPYWHVPHNLAVQDQLPLQRQDPGYFSRVGMRVFRGWGADAREVDPATVDWSSLSARDFPYRLRQDPGPENALGGVKFMFPNRFNVYLHDTPARGLFARRSRDFSSGCIRLERPLQLAVWLLRDEPSWTLERIRSVIARRQEQTARLPKPVPVHLLYWTAFMEEGMVQFRSDIYGRDGPLAEALDEPPPTDVAASANEAHRYRLAG